MKIQHLLLSLMALFMTGCCLCPPVNAEKMLELGSSLTKLSTAVESTVRYKNPSAGISDEDLLVLATRQDPGLLRPFDDYKVRVLSQDKHAIVLVCSKDGKNGLIEDVGCSGKLDRHLWEEEPGMPCEFTLSIQLACPKADSIK